MCDLLLSFYLCIIQFLGYIMVFGLDSFCVRSYGFYGYAVYMRFPTTVTRNLEHYSTIDGIEWQANANKDISDERGA